MQADLEIATTETTINKSALELISSQIQNLSMFAFGVNRPALNQFKENFYARYEHQEIPMVEALDSEFGVGYGYATATTNNLLMDVSYESQIHERVIVRRDPIYDF